MMKRELLSDMITTNSLIFMLIKVPGGKEEQVVQKKKYQE